jgi:SAM-dependent methyltransferase
VNLIEKVRVLLAGLSHERICLVASIGWGEDLADVYDSVYGYESAPEVLNPIVDLLLDLADGGPALEFAVGTGRVALALSARGVQVSGIELSSSMVDRLRRKPGAEAIAVTVGDMTTERIAGTFKLVYLVANSIMNVTTQQEQVATFRNAAAHLEPRGTFVLEVMVPQLRLFPPGEKARVFTFEPDHIGIETLDDLVGQIASSHHWMRVDGRSTQHSAPYRYVWPSELDLMAQLTGFSLRDRWAGWSRAPFTAKSGSQIAVFEKQG